MEKQTLRNNKQLMKEYKRNYYQKNKKHLKEIIKNYELKNKEKLKKIRKEWVKKNLERARELKRNGNKNYAKNHPDRIKARQEANNKLKHLKKEGYEFHHKDYSKPLEVEIIPKEIHQKIPWKKT